MKKMTLTFFLAATLCSFTFAQHVMDVIEEDFPDAPRSHVHDNRIYVPVESTLKVYAGEAFEDFSMPTIGGLSLRFSENIFSYSGSPYLTMFSGTDNWFIGRFTGSGFSTFTLPSPLVSNVVVFNGLVYLVLNTSTGPKLFSYNGTSLTEISSLTTSGRYKLHVAGSFLYIDGPRSGTRSLRRYNGATVSTVPIPSSARNLSKALQIRSTSSVYLVMHDVVYHYNGTTLTEVFRHPYGLAINSPTIWNGTLYFQYSTGGAYDEILYRCTGTTLSVVGLPAGTSLPPGVTDEQIVIYRDRLYIPLMNGTDYVVYRYDGTTWESIYNWGEHGYALTIRERQGKLVFYRVVNDRIAVEYDGVDTFESFGLPPGIDWFAEPKGTTACYHVWLTGSVEKFGHKWTFVKETFDTLCVTPSPGAAPVIPANLARYDRIGIGHYARERDWCWTGIDIDWDIFPICLTPPCAPPQVQTTLMDKVGKVAWQKTFDKPFSASIPLTDTQPYSLSVAVEKDKKLSGVLLLDKELVNKGIEDLSLDFRPKENYFRLTVATDKQQQVPMMMTLRNTAGASLWNKKFTAPFDDIISEFVSKQGDYLQFSLQAQPKSTVTYYPNPSSGKLNVSLEDNSEPVHVTVSDLNGKVITQKQFNEAGEHSIDLTNQKSGLYILIITEGTLTRRELIQLK